MLQICSGKVCDEGASSMSAWAILAAQDIDLIQTEAQMKAIPNVAMPVFKIKKC